tara:strand:+ start:6186 stop:6875 length:690 start_codon:yes stop_codon:yes gene_type:complete
MSTLNITAAVKAAATLIVDVTQKRGESIAAASKREVYEVGKAIVGALEFNEELAGELEAKTVKRSDLAHAIVAERGQRGLESETFSYWLKSAQVYEAMPSAAFFQNCAASFSVSALHELAPLSRPKNFSVGIKEIVAHLVDQGLFKSSDVRAYVQTCRVKASPSKAAEKKPVTSGNAPAIKRAVAASVASHINSKELEKAKTGKASKADTVAMLNNLLDRLGEEGIVLK